MEAERYSELKKYRKILEELDDLKDRIASHKEGNLLAIKGMTYLQAVKRLIFLRNKMTRCPSSIRRIL